MIFVFVVAVVAVVAVLGVVVWVVVWGVAFDAAGGVVALASGVGAAPSMALGRIARGRGARRRQEKRNRMGNAVSFLLSFAFSSLPVLLRFFFLAPGRAGRSVGLPSCASRSIRSVLSCRFLVRFFLFCRARRSSSARPISRRGCRPQAAPGALGALRPGSSLGLKTQERARSTCFPRVRAGEEGAAASGLAGFARHFFSAFGPGALRSGCPGRSAVCLRIPAFQFFLME